jgi:threonine dehydratase
MEQNLPTLADVQAAQELITGIARRTPMRDARWLSDATGGSVVLKCENLQRAGSFKIRGAYTRIARLSDEEKAAGVVAASAGNHAQGVALAARSLGVKATVFMPVGATLPKVTATRDYGAEVTLQGATVDEALAHARAFSERTGAVLVHPFDHADIVAGQGTCGLEIMQDCPDVDTIVVCMGGGGFAAGVAMVAKSLNPNVRVVAVQAAGAAAYPASLAAGHPVALSGMSTMADGIAVGRPGDIPFALVRDYVDEVMTVTEEEISRALLLLLERSKLVVEPGGGAAVAAIWAHPELFPGRTVATLSGGNIDPLLLMRVVRHGLAAAGRYLSISVRVPDVPGSLGRLLSDVGDIGANVVEVEHLRTDPRLAVDEVEIALQLETRGPAHRTQVLERLREHAYVVHVTA